MREETRRRLACAVDARRLVWLLPAWMFAGLDLTGEMAEERRVAAARLAAAPHASAAPSVGVHHETTRSFRVDAPRPALLGARGVPAQAILWSRFDRAYVAVRRWVVSACGLLVRSPEWVDLRTPMDMVDSGETCWEAVECALCLAAGGR